MPWYSIVDPSMERWLTLGVFVACFALILHRRVRIVYIALGGATLLILLGIVNPADAVLRMVDWNVLAIYWGYGVLAILLGESGLPAKVASWVLARIGTEKYALLFLCALAAFLSSFMANPVVVIMLVPLAIEMAERLRGSLFVYLVSLAISSNVVTTVTMVADPPALILAMATGLEFLDFYWFKSRPGLGTLSIVGVIVALLTLLWQFRHLNGRVALREERIDVDYTPMGLLVVSVAFLAFVPMEHPGLVGLVLGIAALAVGHRFASRMLREADWETLIFLVGIFVVVGAVERVGLLRAFADGLSRAALGGPTVYLLVLTWLSVALSSFIDNVPYTILMVPVCGYLAEALGVSPWPFYFGMLVGTGIGGNITPVGATANVIACGILEKRGYRIDLPAYMRISVPFSVAAVLVTHILIQL